MIRSDISHYISALVTLFFLKEYSTKDSREGKVYSNTKHKKKPGFIEQENI